MAAEYTPLDTHVDNMLQGNNNSQILFKGDTFEILKYGDGMLIQPIMTKVFILAYITDSGGVIDRLGIVQRDMDTSPTLLGGIVATNDPDILSAAINSLFEESGIKVRDEDKWTYMGLLRLRGIVDETYPCFSVDMTDDVPDEILKKQDKNGFFFVSLADAISSEDALIQAAFLKLFRDYYEQGKF